MDTQEALQVAEDHSKGFRGVPYPSGGKQA